MAALNRVALRTVSGRSIWIFGYGSLVHRPGFEHARRVEGFILGWRRVWHQGSTDHRGTPEFPGRTVTLEKCDGAITWGAAYELAGDAAQQEETLKYLEWREKQYDVRESVEVWGHPSQALVLGLAEEEVAEAAGVEVVPLDAGSAAAGASGAPLFNPAGESSRAGSLVGAGSAASTSRQHQRPAGTRPLLHQVLCYIASPDTSKNVNYLGPASLEALAAQIARASGPSGTNLEYVTRLADAMRAMGVEDGELYELEARAQQAKAALDAAGAGGQAGHKQAQRAGPQRVVQVVAASGAAAAAAEEGSGLGLRHGQEV